jgi:hypothetical protein
MSSDADMMKIVVGDLIIPLFLWRTANTHCKSFEFMLSPSTMLMVNLVSLQYTCA